MGGSDLGSFMRLKSRCQLGLKALLRLKNLSPSSFAGLLSGSFSSSYKSLHKTAWVFSQTASWLPPKWATQEKKQGTHTMPVYNLLSERIHCHVCHMFCIRSQSLSSVYTGLYCLHLLKGGILKKLWINFKITWKQQESSDSFHIRDPQE